MLTNKMNNYTLGTGSKFDVLSKLINTWIQKVFLKSTKLNTNKTQKLIITIVVEEEKQNKNTAGKQVSDFLPVSILYTDQQKVGNMWQSHFTIFKHWKNNHSRFFFQTHNQNYSSPASKNWQFESRELTIWGR